MVTLNNEIGSTTKSMLRSLVGTVVSLLLLASQKSQAAAMRRSQWLLSTAHQTSFYFEKHNNPVLDLRGGGSLSATSSSTPSEKKKKKMKSSSGGTTKKEKKKTEGDTGGTTTSSDDGTSEGKKLIGQAMEKDTAEALGDAIRFQGDELRSEQFDPLLDRIDQSVYSIGWALGASDQRQLLVGDFVANLEEDAAACAEEGTGGVAGSSASSVLVNYFLKSHGGTYALQCLCSVLASGAGFACLLVPAKNNPMQRVLLQRALLFAMTKHVAGLLGAVLFAAKAIPKVGLRKARMWMEQLAADPVSHYVFYAACVLLWLPPTNSKQPTTFAGDVPWVPAVLVGPILLREVVSTMLVVSDVLVLWAISNIDEDLLMTPDRWRVADRAVRQEKLAKLTSKVSLALEVVAGMVIVLDALVQMGRVVFGNASGVKPGFGFVIKRLFCSRIYLMYLWTRKRKVNKLVTGIRGGSMELPLYVGCPDGSKGYQNSPSRCMPEIGKFES